MGGMRTSFGAVMLTALLAFGCGSDDDEGGDAGTPCTRSEECGSGESCIDERCTPTPDVDACVGACECASASDCPGGSACSERLCIEGECRLEPVDERCAPLGFCDVATGCVPYEDAGAADAGTDAGAMEDAGPEDAGTPDAGGPGGLGAACEDATDCDLGSGFDTVICADRSRSGDVVFPGGYCTVRCLRDGACPDGSVCWQFGFLDRYCVETCSPATGRCRRGYECGTPSTGTIESRVSVCHPAGG
ncbi:MAG: hypothetical protein CMN29_26460 [Sandaracinus sp.]|nr:hypothetical protein [Sandaracinus sp.]